ncbi:MAG: 50S ribosomal protein L23 [Halofilum sp. (in: g-proteobacteria)]|nr:50S ribosomal protein L23 [Halofilum sp. (in: g-proteobacteria)]
MNSERLYDVIRAPHVSEKAARGADESGQHVFRVAPDATKPEIKSAVERLFKVSVVDVRVLNVKGKNKRFGQVEGRRAGWRKAIVRLQPGQDIDYAGFEG